MDGVAAARAQADKFRAAAGADEALVVGPGFPDNPRFGEYLKALRTRAGFASRVEAAEALGLSSEYLRLVEKGERTPALGQVRNFLAVYHADGDVEKLLPNGERADLVLTNPEDGRTAVVEFKSRIREARRTVVLDTNVIAAGLAKAVATQQDFLESVDAEGVRRSIATFAASLQRLQESINTDVPRRPLAEVAVALERLQEQLARDSIHTDGVRQALATFAAAQNRLQEELHLESVDADSVGRALTTFGAASQRAGISPGTSLERDALVGSIVGRLAVADTETLNRIAEILGSRDSSSPDEDVPTDDPHRSS